MKKYIKSDNSENWVDKHCKVHNGYPQWHGSRAWGAWNDAWDRPNGFSEEVKEVWKSVPKEYRLFIAKIEVNHSDDTTLYSVYFKDSVVEHYKSNIPNVINCSDLPTLLSKLDWWLSDLV